MYLLTYLLTYIHTLLVLCVAPECFNTVTVAVYTMLLSVGGDSED